MVNSNDVDVDDLRNFVGYVYKGLISSVFVGE